MLRSACRAAPLLTRLRWRSALKTLWRWPQTERSSSRHPAAAVLKGNLLFTGDIGKWDENGRLHVIGRKKEILVLADGTKIFLPEYEARILTALPGRDFTVLERNGKPVLLLVDKESSTWPEEMRELSRSMVQEELRSAMSQLPRGQQLSEILFTDKPLPRTATGKVKRWEIHCP